MAAVSERKLSIETQFEIYQATLSKWNPEDMRVNTIPGPRENLTILRSVQNDTLIASAWTNDAGQFLRLEFPKPMLN